MFNKFLFLFVLIIVFLLQSTVALAKISGDVRGVTFFYLDGGREDFPWVLEHQYEPVVRAKIDNLFTKYREAGVNWIRLLVATAHFPKSYIYPVPSQDLIKKVNDFVAITRTGSNAGKFKIELMLIPDQNNDGKFTDIPPYSTDKAWYKAWFDNLNFSNIGMIMLGGDLSPCYLSGCEVEALPRNHGAWIKSIWAWKDANYPKLNAAYEVIGVPSDNNPQLIEMLASWISAKTPSVPVVAASLYVTLPSGSHWTYYADATLRILDAYHSVSSKPLWIDEFGKSLGKNWNAQDQDSAYAGFLAASVCLRPWQYPKFAWVAGNDWPGDGKNFFGLVSGFNGTTPIMWPAWNNINLYYNLETCPTT